MFNWLFKKKDVPRPAPIDTLIVSEGIGGHFHYHISTKNGPTLAFCGAKTMHTAIPLTAWGVKDHLPSKWCKNCENTANAFILQHP